MKKIITAVSLVLIFVLSLFFAKPLVNSLILKETAIEYKEKTEKTVTIKKGDFVIFGEYLNEPIIWQVVDVINGEPLLQTKHVICFKAFDGASGDEEDTGRLGSAQWETSTLFRWLNTCGKVDFGENTPDNKSVFKGMNSYEKEEGFLSSFDSTQLDFISDKGVFLLSKEQLSQYFKAPQRIKTATKSALLQDESPYINTTSKGVWYWTSTPTGVNNTSVTTVNASGGFYKSAAYDSITGVAPAVCLSSDEALCVWGNASEEMPYVIKGAKK